MDYLTPTPEPGPVQPAPTPTPVPSTPREIVRAIWEAAGLGWEWPTVERIVQCESSWDVDAVGDQGRALGLFQIRIDVHYWRRPAVWWSGRQWADPAENARLALELRRESGWRPWSCR